SWQLKRGAIGSINMAGSGNNSLQIVLEGRRKDALDLTSKGPLVDCAPEREYVAGGAAVCLTNTNWSAGISSEECSTSVGQAPF
ncbi:MAG TPA: hypothetical protein VIL09_18770, partial [Microvirga sp.]